MVAPSLGAATTVSPDLCPKLRSLSFYRVRGRPNKPRHTGAIVNDPRKATGAFRFIIGKPCRFWTDTAGNGFLMDNWGNLLPVPNIKTITE